MRTGAKNLLVLYFLLATCIAYAQSTNGLVAYYPFNGDANDESGNGNHAINYGATLTSDRFGNSQKAYAFNGTNNYMSAANSVSLQSPKHRLAISTWVYIQGTPNGNVPILVKSDTQSFSGQYSFNLHGPKNNIALGVVNSSGTYIPNNAAYLFNYNEWYHLVVSWDSISVKFYVNNQFISSVSLVGELLADANPLEIGRDVPGATEYFQGVLDDIRIYNRALTESEISELYYENGYNTITYGGKTYHTVTIGAQTWLKENLDIGTMIQGSQNATNNGVIEKYCYDNSVVNCDTYGGLYQWNEAMQYLTTPGAQGICPPGWHIPTYTGMQTLVSAVGNNSNALKAVGQGNGGGAGTNTSGFSALLAGIRNSNGNFYYLAYGAYFWSSTGSNATYAFNMNLYGSNSNVYFDSYSKEDGFSVRCVKDASTSSLTITSPNGGENWTVGTTQNITWTSSGVTNVKLEYTTNNGTDWTTIIASTPASTGSYAWTIPNTPSPNCKVRVSDASNSSVSDISDAVFYIVPVNGIVHGGKIYNTVTIGAQTWLKENLDIGTMIQGSQNASNNSVIEKYCYDNLPANCETYGGLYQWNEAMQYVTTAGTQGICPTGWHIPTSAEFQTLASAVGNSSNALKAVGQGSGAGAGTNSSGFSALLVGDRGINGDFDNLGNRIYMWISEFPDGVGAKNFYLYYADNSVYYYAHNRDNGFSIRCLKNSTTATLQLTSPNGGENWTVGSQQNITWTSANVTNVKLEYTTNNGTAWTTIIANTSASAGSYAWTIPNTPSPNCKVRVSDASNSSVSDISDAVFYIVPVNGIVYGGKIYNTVIIGAQTWLKENLDIGTMIQGSQNATNNSVIEKYCYDNLPANCETYGGLYQWNEAMQYVTTAGAQGICPTGWHIPENTELQILGSAVGNNSNALKAIGQGTGGGAGTNTSGFSALLAGYRNGNGSFLSLANLAYFWSSTDYNATYADYMVLDYSNSYIYFSDYVKESGFSVRCVKDASTSSLTITSPNGGENWTVGTTQNITWTSSGVTNVKLEYTTNNGTDWTTIIASAPASAGSYAWTIPNTPSPNCKVRVSDVGNSAVSDISDNTFSIILPSITVLTPNGGENWQIGRTKNITWSGSNAGSYVKIEYTTNFTDADWTTIADSSANNGSYQWIVPSSASASAKVRVTSKTLPSVSDESNSVFSIVDIAVVSPNGGETLIAGSAHLIAWANTNLTGTQVKIEYSTNNGTNWSEVANNVSNAGQYNWTNIPATTTTNGKIKVSVSTDATIYDESDGVFAVVQLAPAPSLVSPANNATGAALAPTLVWRAVTQASKYHLQVSTNSDFTALVFNDTTLVDTSKQVGGLINLTQYYWRARAKDSNGWGQWASAWTFATVVAPPPAPVLALPLNNSANNPIDILLSWNAVITAVYYRVEVAEDANFTTIIAQDTHRLDTSFPLVQLQYNKKYYWRVRGYNEGGTGAWSAAWNFTTTLPQATLVSPANGSLGNELEVLLQWNGANGADRYHYQLSAVSNFSSIILEDSLLSSTFKQLTNLQPLTVHYWRVRAGNNGGYGAYSEVWTFKTKGTPDLIEVIYPAHNSINIPTNVEFKWRKPMEKILFAKALGGGDESRNGGDEIRGGGDKDNSLEGIQKYWFELTSDTLNSSATFSDSTITDTFLVRNNLSHLTFYYWRVRAKNEAGWGAVPAWNKFRTVIQTPSQVQLSSPQSGAVNQSLNLTLQWNVEPITENYILEVALDSTFQSQNIVFADSSLLGSQTSKQMSGLQYFTKYFWRVRGKNIGGWGGWSEVRNFKTIIEKPTVPQLTLPLDNAIGLIQPITLVWESSERAERYAVEVSKQSNFGTMAFKDTNITITSVILPQLENLTTYYWRVSASNIGGNSGYSSLRNFKTLGRPTLSMPLQPPNNAVNQQIDGLEFKWTKSKDQLETIQRYWFQLATDSVTLANLRQDSTLIDTSKVENGLNNLTYYFWRVRAENETGWGGWSYWSKYRTIIQSPSQARLFKPDSASINQPLNVNLQWLSEPITDNYHLQVSTDANFLTLLLNDSTLTATSKSVSLNYNQTIYWRVRGKNVGGNGLFSNVWHFSTKLAAPNLLLPDSGAVNISIHPQFNWTPVAGAAQYHLQVAKNAGFNPLVINDSTITTDTITKGPLENNQTYYWRVRGRDGLKSGDYSSVRNFTTIISPPQPPALINPPQGAANLATNYIFSWNGVLGAEQYRIQVALDQNFNQMFFDTITSATSKEVRNMALTQKYFWRVSAKNAGGFGQYSEARWFVTLLFPPENLTAMAGNKKITLTWFHTSAKISKFNIYRAQTSPASVLIASVDSTQFGFIDTTTLNNQNYFYRVKAVSIFGTESDYSNEASATPGNLPPVAVLPPAIYNNAGYIRQSDLSFDISQCYDPDGWIDSVFWYVNGTLVSQDSIFNNAYSQGMTDLKLVIKDNDGAVDSAKRIVAITAFRKKFEGPTTNGLSMYKDSIIYVIVTGNSDAVKRIDSLGNDLGQPLNVNGHILSSSSIARDGSVYIGSTDFNLYAFNINGSNLWPAKPLGGLLSSSPAIDFLKNKIYIGTSNNRFVCVDGFNGNDIWTFNIGPNNVVKHSAVITDTNSLNPIRKLFFSTVAGHILGFKVDEITTMLPLADWDGMISDSILSAPAISYNGLFYVGGSSGKMYQIEFRNNQLVPIVTVIGTLDGAIESTPVIDSLGNIYVGTRAGSFYSIKTVGGTNWKIVTKTKAPIKTTGVITSRSNRIVFANQSGEIYSVDRQGKLYWYYRDSSAISNTLMNLKGVTYWGTTSGAVCAVYDSVDIEMYEDVTNPPYWPTLQATPARGGDRSMLNPAMFMTDVNDPSVVTEYALLQNYPNPFNPMTTIEYALPKASIVSLKIYDILGREVATLVNEHQYEGRYDVKFDASSLSSGIYIYRLQAGNFVQNRKLVLVR